MTHLRLKQSIQEATKELLVMAKDCCWNNLSDNVSYFSSDIKLNNPPTENIKNTKSLDHITIELLAIYHDLYDINLHIHKSLKNRTIIEIKYFLKSSIKNENARQFNMQPPMFHSKIAIPIYRNDEKFDINWERGGIRHIWNNLLFKLKSFKPK